MPATSSRARTAEDRPAAPGTGTRQGVERLQQASGNAAAVAAVEKEALPKAAPEAIPTVYAAAGELMVMLAPFRGEGARNLDAGRITRLLLLMRDRKRELAEEFARRDVEKRPLREAISERLSGTARTRVLMTYDQGGLHLADELYFAAKGMATEKRTLDRLLAEAAGVRASVESEFKEKYTSEDDYPKQGTLLDEARTPSWVAGMLEDELSFAVEASWEALPRAKAIYTFGKLRDIDKVHLAIVGPGTNTGQLFEALETYRAHPQRAKDLYKASYGADLEAVLTDWFTGELSGNDRDRAKAFFAGKLDLLKAVELMMGTVSTDEEGIFAAIAATKDQTQLQRLRDALDEDPPTTPVGKRYREATSGLDADDRRRIDAMLPPSKPKEGVPPPPTPSAWDKTGPALTQLKAEGGTSKGRVFPAIKMAPLESWRMYRDSYPQGGSVFQKYVDHNSYSWEQIALVTVLSREPDSLLRRLYWALREDDELYLFHVLDRFTGDETGEDPTRRQLAANGRLQQRLKAELNPTQLVRARALLRPKDLDPDESLAWLEEDLRAARGGLGVGEMSAAYKALLDEHRELRAAHARAHAEGGITPEERRQLERLETRARAALDVYVAVRDELEGYTVEAITTAVGLLLAVPSGGATVGALVGQLAKSALLSGLTRLATERIVRGERFDVTSNEAVAAFAGGAADGVMNVLGAAAAKGLTGPLVQQLEKAGPAAARLAARKSFKVAVDVFEEGLEGGISSVVSSTVEAAAREDTWEQGLTKGVENLAGQAPDAFIQGAALSAVTGATVKLGGRVKRVLANDPKPIVPAPAKRAETATPVETAPPAPVEKAPAPPVEKAPAPPVEKAPTPPVEKAPAPPVEKAPSTPVEKAPAPPVEKAPAPPVEAPKKPAPRVRRATLPPKLLAQADKLERLAARVSRLRNLRADDVATRKLTDFMREEIAEARRRLSRGEAIDNQLDTIADTLDNHSRNLRPVRAADVDTFLASLRKERTRVAKKPDSEAKAQHLAELDKLIDETAALKQRMQREPDYDPRAEFDAFKRMRKRAGAQHYDIPLSLGKDPVLRARVTKYLEAATMKLLDYPGGDALRNRFLKLLAEADELNLSQSPRQAGIRVHDTPEMRKQVAEAVEKGLYPDEYLADFAKAQQGTSDGWPRTPDGRAWEVDHVMELWTGGADDVTNYMALDPRLHNVKTEVLERFRDDFRKEALELGEQVEPSQRELVLE